MKSSLNFTILGALVLSCGVGLVPACSSGGDDDDDGTAGKGGGGSSSGSTQGGSAGSSAGSTTGGTGGAGGDASQVVTKCQGVVPSSPAIADFDTAPAAGAMYQWGSPAQGTTDFWGGTFNYPAKLELSFEDGALTATGRVTEYTGFGLYVQNCANASSYEGVRFKISGNPSPGKMSFAVQTNRNEWANGTKGACLAAEDKKFIDCSHPFASIDVTETPTEVTLKWADFAGGKPAADAKTDGADVIGLQFILPWSETATAYDVSVTVDDVEFIGSGAGGDGSGGAGAGGVPAAAGAGGAE
jgi:hypothetical protein